MVPCLTSTEENMKGVKAIEIENRKKNIGIMQVASISAFPVSHN